jgi:hypothetical protein
MNPGKPRLFIQEGEVAIQRAAFQKLVGHEMRIRVFMIASHIVMSYYS